MDNKKKREPLCGDIVNTLACESMDFQWPIVYNKCSKLSLKDKLKNKVWMSGIMKA
jgi:hypothetical protein